jgi:hypothetical protein
MEQISPIKILTTMVAVLLFMTVSSNAYAQCTNFTQAQNWTPRLWCGTGDSSCSTREYAIYDGKVWTPNYSSTQAPLNSSSNRGYGPWTFWGYAAECEVAPPPPNHYRIIHDGQGVTGVNETVILKACADTNCSSVSTQTTSITLSPSVWGGGNSINITNGSNNVTLSVSSAGTITFGKTTASPNVQLRCFVGNTETCNFVVSDGGGGSCPADSYGIYGLEEIEVKKPFIFNGVTVPKQTTPSNRAIDLNGNIVTPSPAIVLPTLPAITFVNSPDANGSLSPGNYGEWTVNEGAAVTMAPGIYNIDEVDIKDDAIITISPAGPVIINVNKFDMDDGSRLNANAGASAANLTVNYYGISSNNDNKFHLHKDVHFTGIIFSSYDDDKVEVKKDVILKGGIFTAGEVKLEDDAIVTYSAAEQAAAAVVLGCTTVTFDEPEMIAGRVTLKNTNTTAEFSEVCFDQPFSVTPLVFTLPTNDESASNVIRIKNVTTTGFEIAQVQSQGTNSGSVPATIDFVAIVPGQYNLEGGARMDVVSFNTNTFQGKRFPGNQRGYDDVNFSSSFSSAPAIIAAIQTMNNESGTPPGAASMPFLATAIRNVGTTDFDFALERVESLSGTLTNSEQVGYIAIDAGKTGQLMPGINYQSILTPDQITHSCRTYAISISPGGLPLVVASQNRRGGGDGGWLQRCGLSNTSVGVKIDEDIDGDSERAHTSESAGILALGGTFTNQTCSAGPSVHHYEIVHDGQGLTCEPETVTIKACTNDYIGACTLSAESGTYNLKALGMPSNTTVTAAGTFTNGQGTVDLSYLLPELATLSLDNLSIDATNNIVCNDNSTDSCQLAFADAGFRFLNGNTGTATTIENPIAGNIFPLRLQAVENTNGVCTALFNGNKTINLSQENVNPSGSGGLSFSLGSANIAKHPSVSATSLNFDTDSIATIPEPRYHDAGQIRLHANYNESGVSVVGSSNNFWVSPAALVVTAKSGTTVLNGATSTESPSHKAGENFDLTVTAFNSLNVVTPNYSAGQIQLELTRTGPTATGVEGNLTYAALANLATNTNTSRVFQDVSLSSFVLGVSNYSSAKYSEVGLINLDVQDSNYGSAGIIVPATAIDIGRFIPDHFKQTVVTSGDLMTSCNQGTSPFAFSGQVNGTVGAISYLTNPILAITAFNADNVITQNYSEPGYMKLSANSVTITPPTEDQVATGGNGAKLQLMANMNTGTLSQTHLSDASTLAKGTFHYEFSDNDNFYYHRSANALVAPFSSNTIFSVASIIDADGVNVTSTVQASPTAVDILFGRLLLDNSFGPETSNLPQLMQTEHFDGNNFIVTSDNTACMSYDPANISLSNISLVPTLTNVFGGNGNFINGQTNGLALEAPGSGNVGEIGVSYAAPSWLQFDWSGDGTYDNDPTAVASFGGYRGNDRVIYKRELSN